MGNNTTIKHNFSLKKYNTFQIDVKAKLFAEIHSIAQLQTIIQHPNGKNEKKFILGGGSNLLLTKNIDGLVIFNAIKGIEKQTEDNDYVYLNAKGGEIWHELVLYCLKHNYGGIENLSLIPGSVGAAPIQNIGAYGVELKDVLYSVQAVHLQTGELHTFSAKDCDFTYRSSIFKRSLKNRYCITDITLKLHKKPIFTTNYGAIQTTLTQNKVEQLSIQAISTAICSIRTNKLPDPKKIGNCGSFFKNPVVSADKLTTLQQEHPTIPHYKLNDGSVKIPAAWLIEQCGFKGKRIGNTGTYHNHALVLVNHGNASGTEVANFAGTIQKTVEQKFNIKLEPEVNIW